MFIWAFHDLPIVTIASLEWTLHLSKFIKTMCRFREVSSKYNQTAISKSKPEFDVELFQKSAISTRVPHHSNVAEDRLGRLCWLRLKSEHPTVWLRACCQGLLRNPDWEVKSDLVCYLIILLISGISHFRLVRDCIGMNWASSLRHEAILARAQGTLFSNMKIPGSSDVDHHNGSECPEWRAISKRDSAHVTLACTCPMNFSAKGSMASIPLFTSWR